MGDASGIQSPLSFGGFGALTRHLVSCRPTQSGDELSPTLFEPRCLRAVDDELSCRLVAVRNMQIMCVEELVVIEQAS